MSRKLIHRPASRRMLPSRLPASAQQPVGIWGVIVRKKTIDGRMEIRRSPSGRRR